jgi:hypothetical protein
MRFCIPNSDIYRTDPEDRQEGEIAASVEKGIPHTCVDLPPLLSVEGTGNCRHIGNIEIFLAAVYRSPQRLG